MNVYQESGSNRQKLPFERQQILFAELGLDHLKLGELVEVRGELGRVSEVSFDESPAGIFQGLGEAGVWWRDLVIRVRLGGTHPIVIDLTVEDFQSGDAAFHHPQDVEAA